MSINGVEELEYMDEEGEMEEGDFVVLEYPNGAGNGEEADDEYAQVLFFVPISLHTEITEEVIRTFLILHFSFCSW